MLTEEEETNYTTAKELKRYEIPPERDEDSDNGVLRITGPEPQRAPAPVNQVKRGNQVKKSHQAPEGFQPIRSRGERSQPSSEGGRPVSRPMSPRPVSPRPVSPQLERPQPERSQPERLQPENQPVLEPSEEGDKPWARRPFDPVRESYKVVKSQYQAMESFIEEISTYMDSEPADVMNRIKDLPKPEDLIDLQARMDCLLKENVELRARAGEGDALWAENVELRARAGEGDALWAENVELRAQADEGDTLWAENKELKDRMKEAEREAKAA